jgi:cytoskeletal protein RodZ
MGLMSDEKFEEFLKQHAPDYNKPGATPRDEMWTVIAKARSKPKKSWLRYTPWIGMAATLLLGVGIGRFVLQNQPTTLTPTPIAQAPLPAVTEAPAESPAAPATSAIDAPVSTPLPRRTPVTRRETVELTPAITPVNQASREHLVRAEALISVIAATPADAVMDSLTGRWARDMLTNTRLLLDSPAGEDPSRRQLLEDLETVLVLLVQRSGAAVDERALLDRSLQRTQLLTRLRSGAAGI